MSQKSTKLHGHSCDRNESCLQSQLPSLLTCFLKRVKDPESYIQLPTPQNEPHMYLSIHTNPFRHSPSKTRQFFYCFLKEWFRLKSQAFFFEEKNETERVFFPSL